MDNTTKIEISRSAANDLLPILESQLDRLFADAEEAHSRYESVQKTIAELRAKLNGAQSLPGIEPIRKRLPKGEAVKKITALLNSLPDGGGMTIQDIIRRTSVPYSSAFRILNKGLFAEKDGKWSAEYK